LQLLQDIVNIAVKAGLEILAVYRSEKPNIQKKLDHSPVTAADLLADQLIRDSIAQLKSAPSAYPMITEETIGDPAEACQTLALNPTCWLIDPLDGTKDFIAKSGDFAVCISLVTHGKPTLGVLHCPVHNLTFGAASGLGAYQFNLHNHEVQSKTRLSCRSLNFDKFTILTSRFHPSAALKKFHSEFARCEFKVAGSAYKYGLIALAQADLSVRRTPTSLWDIAAAHCILNEAGGGIMDFDGNPLIYNHGSLINPPLIAHGKLDDQKDVLLEKIKRGFNSPP
jgi:3'(2'), 5'-bisphosphate nucleotidase